MELNRRRLLTTLAMAAVVPPKKGMKILSTRPEDYEMTGEGFLDFLTPYEHFYVRCHHYTPEVNAAEWKLSIGGNVSRELTFSLDELRKLPRVELVAVAECAGNGRSLYRPNVPGLQWETGAVGNARWGGVRLGELLNRAGVQPGAIEVLFDGADVPVGAMPKFQRTIPIKKALALDTMLAYEMNGETLAVPHGFPLRLVVPGWATDSWTKWVTRIEVRDKEFDGFFMKSAYRHPGKGVAPGTTVDPAQMIPVTELSAKSILASHQNGQDVPLGTVQLYGAAWAGESPVAAVEVSVNGGRNWKPALLNKQATRYGWRLWSFNWTPPREAYYTVMCRARTAAGETQPLAQEWNPSGYKFNVVPEVGLNVSAHPKPLTPPQEITTRNAPAFFKDACLSCHTDSVITQQRLTRSQWEREVDKMIRWGARVKDENKLALVDYLSNLR